ncbi:MAG: energy-coupling factor transporter transmembrane protein EcfT [Actinobacteria bacterium]|nr:energy-coupling factor transporter transmembrane protein EcfT [Actinomycetota bacterium]
MARRLPRYLHPGAWWLWALGLAAAASKTTNPLLLGLILAVAALVVAARKPDAPWSRSFSVFLKLGLVVIAIRVVFQLILGNPIGSNVILTLPTVPLPEWMASLRLGGQLTLESLILAICDGFRLAVLLACVGAANSLASPSRLLKAMPAALYEVGVAIVVAMTFAPQLVTDLGRVRQARRLRGRADKGIKGAAGAAMPVFEGALDRAITLAAAMDSRGYDRTGQVPAGVRRVTVLLVIAGLIGVCIGLFGLLSTSQLSPLAFPLLAAGLLAAIGGMWLGGRRSIRTRYRSDPWKLPEWIVMGTGLVAASGVIVTGIVDPAALTISVTPLQWPQLPLFATAGVLLAALPAFVAPELPPPARVRRQAGSRAGAPTERLVTSE